LVDPVLLIALLGTWDNYPEASRFSEQIGDPAVAVCRHFDLASVRSVAVSPSCAPGGIRQIFIGKCAAG